MYLQRNDSRNTECFNLDWFFYHGGKEQVPGEKDITEYNSIKLPHDWSLSYPFNEDAASRGSGGYVETGVGWYRKIFSVNPAAVTGKKVILLFDGVYMLARVWVNGSFLGEHIYGYTPFEWDITGLLKKDGSENSIDVRVDNSAQPNSRWYSGSGITRNVWLLGVNDTHVSSYGIYVRQKTIDENKAVFTVETKVHTAYDPDFCKKSDSIQLETSICLADGTVILQQMTKADDLTGTKLIKNESNAAEILSFLQCIELVSPMLWDIHSPYLYKTIVRVYQDGILKDEKIQHTGFRDITFDSQQGFLLNGNRVKLNGVCIHHDGGCVGAAVHPQIWERRLVKLKDMGVNALRMAHNPPDPELLDLCDRLGLMVMDEAFDEWQILKWKELGSNTSASRGYSEWFENCHEEDLRIMLLRDRNHPSVILWSIGNEVPEQTAKDGHLLARHLKEICHELDPDRMITQGNDQICAEPNAARDEFLKELDVVGYNYVNRWRTRMETLYDDDKRKYPNRCMIGTENQSISGVRGEYMLSMQDRAGWWKHPYFSAPVAVGKLLHYTMSHDYVAGDFMWTGIDYLGEAHWPSHAASAGVMDMCGFEKDSYYFYKSIWNRKELMVHLLPHWNLDIEEGTILPVLGYTNCDSTELFLNGRSYGKKAYAYPAYGMTERYGHFDKEPVPVNTDDLFLSWDVPYIPGCIELVGYKDGKEAARHTVRTALAPAMVRLSAYKKTVVLDGLDVVQIEAEILDSDGNLCVQADTELTFSADGALKVIAVDNGNTEDMESRKANHIHAFHGKAFAVLQSVSQKEWQERGKDSGLEESCTVPKECKINVHAAGLQAESICVSFDESIYN